MLDLALRARRAGKPSVLGGPSVSASPERYAAFDYLHLGELGDGTDALIARLEGGAARPTAQVVFETSRRLPLERFPMPAYRLAALDRYFLGSMQFSSGCPYRCEFCDIPELYGRQPRLKSPARVIAELDRLLELGPPAAVYFVDDNFIANRRAARELASALVDWQRRHGYPLEFACEATLNIARDRELLGLLRQAGFGTMFCGIETPDPVALGAIAKGHNAMVPMLDAVRALNAHGIEVVAGIILGLDTDDAGTVDRLLAFVERTQIPMLTVNLLQALPRTPLWRRLAAAGRLVEDAGRESNVAFLRPYETVLADWRRAIAALYDPDALYGRFAHALAHTYPNRIARPAGARATPEALRRGLAILGNLVIRAGMAADYRRTFWRHAWPLARSGRIEELIHVGLVAHHLIAFTREALAGGQNASFYSAKVRAEVRTAAE